MSMTGLHPPPRALTPLETTLEPDYKPNYNYSTDHSKDNIATTDNLRQKYKSRLPAAFRGSKQEKPIPHDNETHIV